VPGATEVALRAGWAIDALFFKGDLCLAPAGHGE
jgi:hypothetical protein